MKILLNISALLIFCSALGQGKVFYNITKLNGDSTFWFRHITERTKKLSIPLLASNSNPEHMRIWTNNQVIDLWQSENGIYSGQLRNWTDEYVNSNEKPTNRTFIRASTLSYDTVQLLIVLFTSFNILALTTQDSIKGWQQGFDGKTYIIERSTKDVYWIKTYWTPEDQGDLSEALLVQSFIDSAINLANAEKAWREFIKFIPFESYYNGGPGAAIRILTDKQRKKYRKERQNYRQQGAL